jgi:MSHA biogenesis protein MshO
MTTHRMRAARAQRGFTLAEAVIVIAITGIISAVVAVFIRKPIEGYFDSVRRAELTDVADVALRRMGRDLRTALPNSVRVTLVGSVYTLQYIETTGGGRYRSAVTSTGTGNALDFTAADTTFEVLGPAPVAATGSVVVGNLGTGTGADAYSGNSSALTAAAGSTISMNSIQFPVESPGRRFQITGPAVSYVCTPLAVGGTLMRGASMLASDVTGCSIVYDTNAAATRSGVVSIWLTLAKSGESVTLFHQVHVVNIP